MPGTSQTLNPGHITANVSLSGVHGVRARLVSNTYSDHGPNNDHADLYIYEIQAYGNLYQDTGLHVQAAGGVQAIGGVTPATSAHKVRIAKNGNIYGIPLLSTGDANASAMRIASGGVVYSFPKAPGSANMILLADTTHTYFQTQGSPNYGAGPLSIDGDFNTAYACGGVGGPNEQYRGYFTFQSQHMFAQPRNITQLQYQVYCYGYAYGDNADRVWIQYNIEYTTDGTNWITYDTASAGNL